ncbi:MAG: ComEC family competence protein [Flavobacterium sp.]|nr:MAG: ComEC family competence protein [Flavobacterium sp.]
MHFIKFPIVRFSFFLILGITAAHFFRTHYWFYILPVALLALFGAWMIARRQVFQKVYFGIAAYLCFFGLGLLNYQLRLPRFQKDHFSHFISEEKSSLIEVRVEEILKPNSYAHKYIAKVLSNGQRPLVGNILIYVPKGDTSQLFSIGDRIWVEGQISAVPPPLNPYQFNYAAFLEIQDVYHQIRTEPNLIQKVASEGFSFKSYSSKLRDQLIHKLDDPVFGDEERGIIQALILGKRNNIQPDLYQSYAAAGAIHILAVSGLHVGIIYFLLLFVLKPLRWLSHGKKIQLVILVLLLWGYALLTGLSPSVTRAVTMFSFFALAQLLNRPTNSINTLFLSLFFLLIWNPKWLFHVGFQLSYAAVFFILWLQPQLYKLYTPRFFPDKLIWGIFTVSIAAQLGVAPLSIYYFNQFPGLFLLSNLVILPFLSLLVCFGIVIIILISLEILPDWLAGLYNKLIGLLNQFVNWIASQESFLVTDIHFPFLMLVGLYVLILGVLTLGWPVNFKRVKVALCCILFFQFLLFLNSFQATSSQLTIFHKTGHSLIGIRKGKELKLLKADTLTRFGKTYPIRAYRTAMDCEVYSEEKIPDIISYTGKIMLIVDSSAVYPYDRKVDIVVLRGNPKVHLERIIDSLQPALLVADGSNYRSYVNRWRATCKKRKLTFHFTGERGAFILE